MSVSQQEDYIYIRYSEVIKPLLADLELRGKGYKIPRNCLNEIRAINDHIARCYRKECINRTIEYNKAEGHLQRLAFDCFKQLNLSLFDKIERCEKRYFSNLWLYWDKGEFWGTYLALRKKATKSSIEAKKNETLNADVAMKHYEETYCCYCEIEALLNENNRRLKWSFVVKWFMLAVKGGNWLLTTFLLSLVAAIISVLIGLL